jgi:hypothetical protein
MTIKRQIDRWFIYDDMIVGPIKSTITNRESQIYGAHGWGKWGKRTWNPIILKRYSRFWKANTEQPNFHFPAWMLGRNPGN